MPRRGPAGCGTERMRTAPLTAGELAPIPDFIGKWIRIGLSAVPVDHARAERALCRLYTPAGLAEPAVVWAPCPMTAMPSPITYTAIPPTGREPHTPHPPPPPPLAPPPLPSPLPP